MPVRISRPPGMGVTLAWRNTPSRPASVGPHRNTACRPGIGCRSAAHEQLGQPVGLAIRWHRGCAGGARPNNRPGRPGSKADCSSSKSALVRGIVPGIEGYAHLMSPRPCTGIVTMGLGDDRPSPGTKPPMGESDAPSVALNYLPSKGLVGLPVTVTTGRGGRARRS